MIAVVILNKDNAEGLKKCLESLEKQSLTLCKDFVIVVADGGSRDDSEEVALSYRRKYPCIYFFKQWSGKGTGPARNDSIKFINNNLSDVDIIVWGDSENIYEKTYLEELLRSLNKGCLLAGGLPIVKSKSILGKSLFWYHTFYVILPFLAKYHIAGNNLMVRKKVYKICGYYPQIIRADDLYWNEICRKKGLKFCLNNNAKVYVRTPQTFHEFMKWEESRVRGLIQGGKLLGVIPRDIFRWTALFIFYVAIITLSFFINNFIFISLFSIIAPVIFLEIAGHKFVKKAFIGIGIVSFILILLHSIVTTVLYFKCKIR